MIRKTAVLLLVQVFILLAGNAQVKAIYTMFLQEPVPANGTAVAFNCPVLRWPYQKGKQVKYDLRLSQDSGFSNAIAATNLQGAVFNPHQQLANGKWFWQYRVAGKEWSDIKNFIVTAQAFEMVSPAANVLLSKIPDQHPRILPNHPADNIKNLAGQADARAIIAAAETVMTERILTEADAQTSSSVKNEKQDKKNDQDAIVALGHRVYAMVHVLCEASLLTGKEAYAAKAIAIAMEVASWNPEGISGSRDFTDGKCMYNMALVFDTYYDKLDEQQRKTLQQAIAHRAAGFYKSWVNNIESKVLSGHVWQLLLNEFFKSSLALYTHEPAAAQWLSYAYDLFLARSPVLGGLDGGWVEGAYYFKMNMDMLIDIPDKIKTYTGFDFVNAHPWYRQQADWMIYQLPPGSSSDGYGDNTEELHEPPLVYAAYADIMYQLTGNNKYSWYLQKMQLYKPVNLAAEQELRWYRLVNSPQFIRRAATDTLQLPMGHMFTETGVASLHTDPAHTKKDISIAMRSSPFGAYGHILADQNTFNILAGGKRLFFRTGYKVAMDDPHRLGWSKHTKSMNGVLINGQGEPYSAEAYGWFTRFIQGRQLAYMKGDASNAYQSAETKEDYGVKKYFRHVVMLQPGIIVIYDELASKEDAEWSWLIHSIKSMKLDTSTHTFISTIDNAKGVGRLWSSEPFRWTISNKFDVAAVRYRSYKGGPSGEYDDSQWHIKAINSTKTSAIRFLSVIQVSQNGKQLSLQEMMTTAAGIKKIKIGGWEIEASLSRDMPASLSIQSVSGQSAFSACGSAFTFHGESYGGNKNENTILAEWINGKTIITETGDIPLPAIR